MKRLFVVGAELSVMKCNGMCLTKKTASHVRSLINEHVGRKTCV